METPDKLLAEAYAAAAAGDFAKAEAACRRALEGAPADGGALNLLGIVLARTGRAGEAAEVLAQAAKATPEEAAVHNNLGNALSALGRLEEAVAAFGSALAIEPGHGRAHSNLATVLKQLGRPEQALQHYRKALSIEPLNAEIHANCANLLAETGRTEEALAGYRRALEIDPASPGAHNNLGACLKNLGHYQEAAGGFRRALELAPNYADALSNLGQTLLAQGEAAAAVAHLEKAVEAGPGRADIHSNLLLALNSIDGRDALAEHRRWGQRFAAPEVEQANDQDPERPLRVGYVSADFKKHSVACFIEPVLEAHDNKNFEIFCYANVGETDEVSERLRRLAGTWRDIYRSGDQDVAERIRGDKIDVLVDLSGHTAGNRLGVFALSPAPVRVSWLGYPNTTGLAAMDYRLGDRVADPPGAEAHYAERLVRLQGFLCYRPPADAPETARFPGGPLTFASCNNLTKVGPGVVAAWAAILKRVADSRLFLKAKALGDEGSRHMLAARFAEQGISPERLEMTGWVTSGSHLRLYGGIDVALDTFPYNGATTTCEALWMGVPVVSLEGGRHAGRVGASLLARVGLGDLVAGDAAEYVEIAARLAADGGRLEDWRSGLRAMMGDSGLLDGKTFTRGLEAAYREMWRDWCGPKE